MNDKEIGLVMQHDNLYSREFEPIEMVKCNKESFFIATTGIHM